MGRFLFLNTLQSQTPQLAQLLSPNTFYLSQIKAFKNISPFPRGSVQARSKASLRGDGDHKSELLSLETYILSQPVGKCGRKH